MDNLLAAAAAALMLTALWKMWRARLTMNRLERMLDEAIEGRFSERRFDESRLSRAESRLAHYLSASAISAGHVAEEKAKLQSLIADISHQTKTPLSNILLYTQLLAEMELSGEGQNCVAALEGQTKKLQSLLDALVKTSRLETGILTLRPVSGPLLPMLEEAVGQFLPSAAGKGISLTLTPTDAVAVFDPKWTAEAVCNLLDNAVKYTPAGGKISVRAVRYEMFCRVDVADTGPGVPEAEQPKIFQRFYRSDAAREAEGVGVGLYLARQIAEGQGGYLKVSSKPGHGAVFSLCLPTG
ncbi:MAG: HAMP domain-containing histidine kinase [Oscillospiraceae bacterium]|nr:HAMP domain-containing histidine kinase [Oscillospiraceae bacterium]